VVGSKVEQPTAKLHGGSRNGIVARARLPRCSSRFIHHFRISIKPYINLLHTAHHLTSRQAHLQVRHSYFNRSANNATHLAPRAHPHTQHSNYGLPSTHPPIPLPSPPLTPSPEPRRLQIRRRRRSLSLSNQRRPPRTPPKTRLGNNRPRQRPLHFQKPRRKFRMSLVSHRTPKRWFLSRSHAGT
jgi:hypothetical protein